MSLTWVSAVGCVLSVELGLVLLWWYSKCWFVILSSHNNEDTEWFWQMDDSEKKKLHVWVSCSKTTLWVFLYSKISHPNSSTLSIFLLHCGLTLTSTVLGLCSYFPPFVFPCLFWISLACSEMLCWQYVREKDVKIIKCFKKKKKTGLVQGKVFGYIWLCSGVSLKST